MSTAEDVFYLYERNSRIYYDCNYTNTIEECPDSWNNECYCYLKQDVKPFTIGDQREKCSLNRKCYIKHGDECPICFEPIMSKSKAFITSCGHHYHKKCILKYIETKWLSSAYVSMARCPMCRHSLGHQELIQRYRSSYYDYNFKDDNGLDKLEDFWVTHEYRLPMFCSNEYNHYLGMNNNCHICNIYRKKGELLYEF